MTRTVVLLTTSLLTATAWAGDSGPVNATVISSWAPATPAPGPSEWTRHVLSNEGLVMLAQAGFSERFLMELVQSQPSKFDTTVQGLVYLAKSGMSEKMVRLILAAQDKQRQTEQEEQDVEVKPTMAPARWKAVKRTVWVPEAVEKTTEKTASVREPRKPNDVFYMDSRLLRDKVYLIADER